MTLLARYESVRRKQQETLRGLVDSLSKVDGLPAEELERARDALFHADHPFLIPLIGGFNTGKSSILNALIGEAALGVGPTPTTDRLIVLRHGSAFQRMATGETDTVFHPSKILEQVSLVDTPGLESVFKGHDAITNRFLHRADAVFFVLLSTQAMNATNIEVLKSLRYYGKKVILLINQIDLVDPPERDGLRDFVAQQAKSALETEPEIWLVSAKLADQARAATPRDAQLWEASGFGAIERFMLQLGDADRVRGKLETPLQIVRNVTTLALDRVREEQNAMIAYKKSAENVRAQIDQGVKEQGKTVTGMIDEIGRGFDSVGERGGEAIRSVFQINKTLPLLGSGFAQMTGLNFLARGLGMKTTAKNAFESAKVYDPLEKVGATLDTLPAQLEGRDIKDSEELIGYTKQELATLPDGLKGKLIGSLSVPMTYDRTMIPAVRPDLVKLIDQAKAVEFERIDQSIQATAFIFLLYEIAVLVIAIVVGVSFGGNTNGGVWILLVLLTLVFMLGGLLIIPLRGILMAGAYRTRIDAAKTAFRDKLRGATESQIAYGSRLRVDTVTPFLRLVESQTGKAEALKKELEGHQKALIALESEVAGIQK
jgi:GTP-binding protein EngB required for normal cell division